MTGWTRLQNRDFVDITPRGEESRHIVDERCECEPRLSRDTQGRLMIIHNSWEERADFEHATRKYAA